MEVSSIKLRRRDALKQRLITGVIAGAGFLSVVYVGGIWLTLLLAVIAMLGYYEYSKLEKFNGYEPIVIIGYSAIIYAVIPWDYYGWNFLPFPSEMIWLIMFVFMALPVIYKNKLSIDQVSFMFLGIIYLGFGFHYMVLTRLLDDGLFWTLLIFACIWAADSGAYFTGIAIGKHKLLPEISPKKTIEGAIGGVVISVAAALCFYGFKPELLSLSNAIILGVVIAIAGQLGDLIESAYKRIRHVKDSGSILPGHGGILDRCDSWLIVFPVVYILSLLPQ
jgi:phosphatidate cytidylyltransferase